MNKTNTQRQTALMLAIQANQLQAAELLLNEAGPIDADGFPAIIYALKRCFFDLAKQLIPSERKWILQTTTLSGDGKTVLMHCVQHRQNDLAKLFLNRIGCVDNRQQTALMMAAKANNHEIIPFLKEEMKITAKNETALMIALENGSHETALLLIGE